MANDKSSRKKRKKSREKTRGTDQTGDAGEGSPDSGSPPEQDESLSSTPSSDGADPLKKPTAKKKRSSTKSSAEGPSDDQVATKKKSAPKKTSSKKKPSSTKSSAEEPSDDQVATKKKSPPEKKSSPEKSDAGEKPPKSSAVVAATPEPETEEPAAEPVTFDELEATDAPGAEPEPDTNTNTNTAEGEAIAVQVLDEDEELDVDTMLASIEEQGPAEETDALTETSDDEAVPYEVLDDDDDDLDIDEVLASIEELGAKQHLEVPETVESIDVTVLPASDDVPAESVDDDEAEGAELSKPEERDRLIAQALAHAETQDARYRQRIGTDQTGRWKGLLAVIVFVIAGYVGAAPPAWVQGEGAPAITESDQLRGLRVSLLLQAREVETFRALNQRLPESLDELSGRLPGISFVPSGQRTYQLFGITPAGRRVVYDPVGLDADFESLESELASVLEGS